MTVSESTATALAKLLAWDASFLPVVEEARRDGAGIVIRIAAPGTPVIATANWPLAQRTGITLQLVVAAVFLFERGWYPERALLRQARVSRGKDGVWVRLAGLPRWQLEDPRLERRLRRTLVADEAVLVRLLSPVLAAAVPEHVAALQDAARDRPAWEVPSAWLGVLCARMRGQAALNHPAGRGRALWARRFSVPEAGVAWVEEAAVLGALAGAARVAAAPARGEVVAGMLDESDVARAVARASGQGRDAVVLTALSLPGAVRAGLAGGLDAVWLLAARGELAHAHARAAAEAGIQDALLARRVLEAGAASAFALLPQMPAAEDDHRALASPLARRALAWLEQSPVGLRTAEVALLDLEAATALAELERLGLARRRGENWRATVGRVSSEPHDWQILAERLPPESAAGTLARALSSGDAEPARAWCEARLERGDASDALEVARCLVPESGCGLLAAEACLWHGALSEALALLEAVAAGERTARWHALAGWWAEGAGFPSRAAAELAEATPADLPARLAARCDLVAAELARRGGDRLGEKEHIARAATRPGPSQLEAEMLLAAWHGSAALRSWRRRRSVELTDDGKASCLHLQAIAAYRREAYAAAATGYRAALRLATGRNLRQLGEIHNDLGITALLLERPAIADRHLLLAQRLLERCGSARAASHALFNRATLANDRLEWRLAMELIASGGARRGHVEDISSAYDEAELARAELARGDTFACARRLRRLEPELIRHDNANLNGAVAALQAQLALACGDPSAAAAAARTAEEGERRLITAVVDGDAGTAPPAGLPQRWGLALSAAALAAWRKGATDASRGILADALERTPREAAVGLARMAAILGRHGEELDQPWAALARRAEETLAGAGLDGWADILRRARGLDPTRLIQALDAVVNAGSHALDERSVQELLRALGGRWLEVQVHGAPVAAVGTVGGDGLESAAGGVVVRAGGLSHGAGQAALDLLARFLATSASAAGAAALPVEGKLLGASAALSSVREQIARFAPLPLTVLILGEPGTGKEIVARELHQASGRSGPFIPLNCAGIPATLLEAELFGVTRGAFTGADRDRQGLVEAAEGGTLFLDEIGELPRELQSKLLRLLQEGEVRRLGATRTRKVDVRFVAATNRDLRSACASGEFRQDLYYRLAVAVIEVPPLRARPDDIEELARHIVTRLARELGRPGVRLAPVALDLLRRAPWPGNVRELDSVLARAVAAARPGETLGPHRFPELAGARPDTRPRPPWSAALAGFRRDYFANLLRECGGNRSEAARRAGVSRQTLLHHLRELKLGGDEKE
jgi:DNA-binding NtrC family response regulator